MVDSTAVQDKDATAQEVEARSEEPQPAPAPLVSADLLVEDVSIDGMCGVY